ncbi:MAG: acyl carrier protein [Gammaproteobacteria bacterium]|nr:MAG: acyl carrier protein [Gammaproteobacteria bacterium]
MSDTATELESEIRHMIVEAINLEDIAADDIAPEEALFDDNGLGLDSIDALEIGVALQKHYGVRIDSRDEKLPEHFRNIRSIARLIAEHGGERQPA